MRFELTRAYANGLQDRSNRPTMGYLHISSNKPRPYLRGQRPRRFLRHDHYTLIRLAEADRFERSVCSAHTIVFKTTGLNHSPTLPYLYPILSLIGIKCLIRLCVTIHINFSLPFASLI